MVLGLASSGVHSNGYSLVRRDRRARHGRLDATGDARDFDGRRLARRRAGAHAHLRASRARADRRDGRVKGIAHITGGGLLENVPRSCPIAASAVLASRVWPQPPLFGWLQRHGGIAAAEMHRVFNCGIGMVVVVAATEVDASLAQLRAQGETAWRIGDIVERAPGAASTVVL